jgi:phosphate transport system protein
MEAVRHFQAALDQLRERLLQMGGLAEERVRDAVAALVSRDDALIARVVTGDEPLNALHIDIDDRCFRLLALHQPMATDLRTIVAAVKINTDLERVGDLAVNIAEAAKRYVQHPPVKQLVDIPRMGKIAQAMLRDALDAYVRRERALAQSVLDCDDQLDALKSQVFRELLTYMLQDPSTIEPALDLVLVSRHLERIGDHATNIAEDVIFMVSAEDVRHHPASRH